MPNRLALSRSELVFLGTIAIWACILFLGGLGGQYLWQDEAQSALIGKSILTFGVPMGHDGVNSFSQERGLEYNDKFVYTWHPWFHFYVIAASFAVLGPTTIAARLPFALFGIATVFLTYAFARRIWRHPRTAMLATILVVTSVPFLLLARQCRYYSAAAFFALLALYFYHGFLAGRKYAKTGFFVAMLLLLHTAHIYCATAAMAVLVHAALFNRRKLLPLVALIGGLGLVNLPWMFWLFNAKMNSRYGLTITDPKKFMMFCNAYSKMFYDYIFAPALLLIPVVGLSYYWGMCDASGRGARWFREMWRAHFETISALALLLLFTGATFAVVVVASPAPYFRYFAPIVPVVLLVAGYLVDRVVAQGVKGRVLAIVIMGVMIFRYPMCGTGLVYPGGFLYEISHPISGPVEGIVSFLNSQGSKSDVVAVTYEDMPIKFYTGMRVVGGLTGEDLSQAKNADFVIIRQYITSEYTVPVLQYLQANVDLAHDYEHFMLNAPDTAFENRESLDFHIFRSAPSTEKRVEVFKRIKSKPRGGDTR